MLALDRQKKRRLAKAAAFGLLVVERCHPGKANGCGQVMKKICFLSFSIFISSCATESTSDIPKGMRVATPDRVTNCKLLGDVHGVSSLYGVFAENALAKARQQAFEQALAMKANTIVWGPFSTPYGSTSVSGLAYACPEVSSP